MSALQTDVTIKLHEQETISGTFYTDWIDVQQMEGFSFHILWSGGAGVTGVATLEGSNDLNPEIAAKIGSVVDRSGQKLSGTPGSHVYDVSQFHFRFMRLKIDITANAALFDVYFNSRSRRS